MIADIGKARNFRFLVDEFDKSRIERQRNLEHPRTMTPLIIAKREIFDD